MNIRKKCKIKDCNRLGRNKGFYKGETRYDNVCELHHRVNRKIYYFKKQNIKNKKCKICGWDKAPCDRHRKNPSLGYIKRNVIILCPNCHRIEEYKKYD